MVDLLGKRIDTILAKKARVIITPDGKVELQADDVSLHFERQHPKLLTGKEKEFG